jgi:hypothetical protein
MSANHPSCVQRSQVRLPVVGLERGSPSLVSTIEELLERNSSGSGLENREYGLGIYRADRASPSIRNN